MRSLQHACASISEDRAAIGRLDADTAISNGTFRAALAAAGAVCRGVDQVMAGQVSLWVMPAVENSIEGFKLYYGHRGADGNRTSNYEI